MKCGPCLSYSYIDIFRATIDPRSQIKEVLNILYRLTIQCLEVSFTLSELNIFHFGIIYMESNLLCSLPSLKPFWLFLSYGSIWGLSLSKSLHIHITGHTFICTHANTLSHTHTHTHTHVRTCTHTHTHTHTHTCIHAHTNTVRNSHKCAHLVKTNDSD